MFNINSVSILKTNSVPDCNPLYLPFSMSIGAVPLLNCARAPLYDLLYVPGTVCVMTIAKNEAAEISNHMIDARPKTLSTVLLTSRHVIRSSSSRYIGRTHLTGSISSADLHFSVIWTSVSVIGWTLVRLDSHLQFKMRTNLDNQPGTGILLSRW